MRHGPPQSPIQAMPAMSEGRSCQGAPSNRLDPAIACRRRRERALHDLSDPPAAPVGQDLRRLPGARKKGRAITSCPGRLQRVWRGPPRSVQTMPTVSEGSSRPRSAPTAAPDRMRICPSAVARSSAAVRQSDFIGELGHASIWSFVRRMQEHSYDASQKCAFSPARSSDAPDVEADPRASASALSRLTALTAASIMVQCWCLRSTTNRVAVHGQPLTAVSGRIQFCRLRNAATSSATRSGSQSQRCALPRS
jgi:hypothetical protein